MNFHRLCTMSARSLAFPTGICSSPWLFRRPAVAIVPHGCRSRLTVTHSGSLRWPSREGPWMGLGDRAGLAPDPVGTCSPCPAGPRALSPASTSWALRPPAQASRITSLGLLCYTFTLFFDYRSLLCAIIVDTDHVLAGVSTSRWLPLPQAWVCCPRRPLV